MSVPPEASALAPAAKLTASRPVQAMCLACLAAWFTYLLIAPTVGVGWIDSWHNEQRALEVLLLALSALALALASRDAGFVGHLPALAWPVFAFFLLGALSAWRAPYRDAAFAELGLHLGLLALVMLAAATMAADPARALRWVRRASLLLLVAYLSGVASRYAAALSIHSPLRVEVLLLGYANPRFPSALHALLIPWVAGLAIEPGEAPLLRRASLACLALTWALNLALGTRAIWFAMGVAGVGLGLYAGWARLWPLLRVLLATAVAGVLAYLLLFKVIPSLTGIGSDILERSLDKLVWGSNRELLIATSLQAIARAPWLGIGPMQFAAIPGVWAAHPHNWVLQLAAEWGLPAAGLALYGAVQLFRRAVPRGAAGSQAGPGQPAIECVLAAGVALVYGLVDGNLVMPVSQAASALVFACLLASLPPASSGAQPPGLRRGLGRRLALACVLAAMVQLCWFSARTVGPATAEEARYRYMPSHVFWPRFWSEGFLPLPQ